MCELFDGLIVKSFFLVLLSVVIQMSDSWCQSLFCLTGPWYIGLLPSSLDTVSNWQSLFSRQATCLERIAI